MISFLFQKGFFLQKEAFLIFLNQGWFKHMIYLKKLWFKTHDLPIPKTLQKKSVFCKLWFKHMIYSKRMV